MAWRRGNSQRMLAFEAFGVPVQIALSDPDLEPHVREILPPGARDCRPSASDVRFGISRSGEHSYDVTIGEERWVEQGTFDVAMNLLDAQIRLFIAAATPDWIFVHAGVVALEGRALVAPGESFSGKTTLVTDLVLAGATYYSDEYAVFDAMGLVHPYPRRLSIRSRDGSATRELHVSEVGGLAGEESAPVATVVLTRYRAGATWQPERRSSGRGLVALLANTVPAQDRPRESLSALSKALAGATILEGDRGEAGPVAEALLEELAALAH